MLQMKEQGKVFAVKCKMFSFNMMHDDFFVMYAQFVAMLCRNYFKSCQHKNLYSIVALYFLSVMFTNSTGTYMVFPLSIGNCSLAIQSQLWMTPEHH